MIHFRTVQSIACLPCYLTLQGSTSGNFNAPAVLITYWLPQFKVFHREE
jgi:hypothetical protein